MNEAEVQKHLEFLMSGGSLGYGQFQSLSIIKEEMVEAGRRYMALRACLQSAAIKDIDVVWRVFDGGELSVKSNVEKAAAAAAENLKRLIDLESTQ